MLTGNQVRMAKAALGWSNTDLAKAAGIHKNTINKAELGTATNATMALLKVTLEKKGITFLEDGQVSKGKGVSYEN